MRVIIKFSNILAEKIGKEIVIYFDRDVITLTEFIEVIRIQSWSNMIIENNHLLSPVILIIDNNLIQLSEMPSISITQNSDIQFHLMFAGG
ncbi:MAG: hypothetical protein OEY49_18805 [Candidatus Heimdallarchaeota archaeon]|nr:hypothetical protein [Candidatus Heimdallarchaeota archaeon]